MLLIYSLKMENSFADECLKYHSQADADKDVVLLDELRYYSVLYFVSLANFNVIERLSIAGLKPLLTQKKTLKLIVKTLGLSNLVPCQICRNPLILQPRHRRLLKRLQELQPP